MNLKLQPIERIRLSDALPQVFVGEPTGDSQVWNTQVEFRRGEVTLIEAASGTGKSSLCAYIYGARRDYAGKIFFNDTDLRTIPINTWQELRRSSLAYLPQELALFPELSAIENIRLKNRLTGFAGDRRIDQWLERLGIADRRDYPAGRMSIGQQQRVAIIRSLCQPFDFIMLDEPVSHLDEDNNRIAAAMIMEVAREQGAGVIITSVGNPLLVDSPHTISL